MTLVEAHDRVEARVAELMGTVNVATAELVGVIAEVVENETWATAAGIKSPEHWVTWQCGVSPARAAALVQTARRLQELPLTAALFDTGQLSEDSMGAIARRAPAERDEEIAEHVTLMLYSQMDRLLRTMPKPDKAQVEPKPSSVSFVVDDDRWKLRADLSLDEGALVEKALTAGRSQVFYERHPDATSETRRDVTWVDGLVRAADLALRGLGNPKDRPADRYQVLLHIDVTDRTAMLHLGSVVPDPIRRYLACDADVRALIEGNEILAAMSSRMRTVDDRMRAFVENRDGGCRVPGCTQKHWLHIHHLVHWEDGGPTESCNLCALCPLHHRLHHLGLLEIRGDPNTRDGLHFFDKHGREIGARAMAPPERPLHPPPKPYVHPTGERIDWHWFNWRELEREREFN
jgi:hypothetical protein